MRTPDLWRLSEQTCGQEPIPFFARLLQCSKSLRGCFCGGGCHILCTKAQQAHTRQPPHLPRCPQKVFSRRSKVVDVFDVRSGLDSWVCACVLFTEQLRAPQARLITSGAKPFRADQACASSSAWRACGGGLVWSGVVWCGLVWSGLVWSGLVWCGVVWCGVVRCGAVRCCVSR